MVQPNQPKYLFSPKKKKNKILVYTQKSKTTQKSWNHGKNNITKKIKLFSHTLSATKLERPKF